MRDGKYLIWSELTMGSPEPGIGNGLVKTSRAIRRWKVKRAKVDIST